MHFRYYSLRIKISFKISFQCSLKLILIKKFHGTFSRVLWNFLNNIWTTPVVPVIPNRKFCMIYPTTLINLVISNMHRAEVNGNSLWDIIFELSWNVMKICSYAFHKMGEHSVSRWYSGWSPDYSHAILAPCQIYIKIFENISSYRSLVVTGVTKHLYKHLLAAMYNKEHTTY